ncbi:MAG: M42 family peptidase [Clostridia bacterium]|nr:M42 family peptidase [Clostridia bacterium]
MLGRLSEIYGVSGDEGRVRAFIKKELAPYADEMHTDRMGNLIVHKKGEGKKIMLDAHMDEVGLLVLGIREDGLLAITGNSMDPRVLVSKRVVVGPDLVPGVIGAKAIHLQSAADRESALKVSQLYVDIGAKDKEDAMSCVSVGDHICFTTKFSDFGEGLFKGKALDDRIGCALVMKLMMNNYDCDLYGVFTVQEEVGIRGAQAAAFSVQPDIAIAFEGTTANDIDPKCDIGHVTKVGYGPAISFMDGGNITRPQMFKALVSSAKEAGIKYQLRQGTRGRTDAGMAALAASGCFAGGISVPTRYIHSPVSIASWDDFNAAYALADHFLANKKFLEVNANV